MSPAPDRDRAPAPDRAPARDRAPDRAPAPDRDRVTIHRTRRRGPSTMSLTVRTALLSAVLSLLIVAGLAWQMAVGGDPAIGPAAATADSRTAAPASSGSAGSSPALAAAPVVSSPAPAPVVSSPAPVTSSTS